MENIENNKLIAEFMGTWIKYRGVIKQYPPLYHTSWDWLMPVVEKVEEVEGFDMMEIQSHSELGHSCTFYFDSDDYSQQRRMYGKNKLAATYKAVVEFIKWYNENKHG